MASLTKKMPGMDLLAQQLNSQPAAQPFQTAAYQPQEVSPVVQQPTQPAQPTQQADLSQPIAAPVAPVQTAVTQKSGQSAQAAYVPQAALIQQSMPDESPAPEPAKAAAGVANTSKVAGMDALAAQISPQPAKPANATAKAAGMPGPQDQRAGGFQGAASNAQVQAGAGGGLGALFGQQKAVGTGTLNNRIDPLKNASAGALGRANDTYTAGGWGPTKSSGVSWQGPVHVGPTGFINYSDFRGANAGAIGEAATNYRNHLGSLQKAARDAALKYEKSQDPKDREAWLNATYEADDYEKTNKTGGGSSFDRALGSFTGQYDKANASWDAERKDLGLDVSNESKRLANKKISDAADAERASGEEKAQSDAAAADLKARQDRADQRDALQRKYDEMNAKTKWEVGSQGMADYQKNTPLNMFGDMYAGMNAGSAAVDSWEREKADLAAQIEAIKAAQEKAGDQAYFANKAAVDRATSINSANTPTDPAAAKKKSDDFSG